MAPDDDHIYEFLERTEGESFTSAYDAMSAEERAALMDLHRRRSFHVHCWAAEEFLPVLAHGIRHLGHRWLLVDGVTTEDGGPTSIEFGFVLAKTDASVPPDALAERLASTWSLLASRSGAPAAVAPAGEVGGAGPVVEGGIRHHAEGLARATVRRVRRWREARS